MKRLVLVLLCAAVVLSFAPAVNAQATRTWVSGVGNDANPCSRTAPCKTFAGAISKTAKDGEISVLDPGGYGGVTITKSITINGDGTLAGILNLGAQGITVNITDALDVRKTVVLRSISINGGGGTATGGLNGIRILAANQVTIDNVTISNQAGNAIEVNAVANTNVTILNTRIDRAGTGIRVGTSTGLARVTMDNVVSSNVVTNGVDLAGNSRAVIRNSIFTRANNGVLFSAATAVGDVDNTLLSQNTGAALAVNIGGATARISRSSFFENGIGINLVGGANVASDGNNVFGGNGANGAPNNLPAPLVKQ